MCFLELVTFPAAQDPGSLLFLQNPPCTVPFVSFFLCLSHSNFIALVPLRVICQTGTGATDEKNSPRAPRPLLPRGEASRGDPPSHLLAPLRPPRTWQGPQPPPELPSSFPGPTSTGTSAGSLSLEPLGQQMLDAPGSPYQDEVSIQELEMEPAICPVLGGQGRILIRSVRFCSRPADQSIWGGQDQRLLTSLQPLPA